MDEMTRNYKKFILGSKQSVTVDIMYAMITICSYVSLRHNYYKEPIHGIALGDDREEKHSLGQLMDVCGILFVLVSKLLLLPANGMRSGSLSCKCFFFLHQVVYYLYSKCHINYD